MKIITNPPFFLCRTNKKALKDIYKKADDYVILATWKFCNNTLGQQELIMPEEWKEISQAICISVKHLPRNREEKPKFYFEKTSEYKDGFYVNMNGNYTTVERPSEYKQLRLVDLSNESFIRKSSTKSCGHYFAKGEKREVYVVPKKDYSKYEEQIFIDTLKWATSMFRIPHIRHEFVDENNNEYSEGESKIDEKTRYYKKAT